MNDIEKRARELLAVQFNPEGREQFERGQAVVVTTASALNAIVAALTIREGELLARGSVNLLDQQHSGVVPAQELDVVPAAALGADEAGAVGIGGQGDHSVGVELAQVASEHGVGVQAASDSRVTANLTPPEGYVLMPVDLAESSMQLLYSASNGKENIFAATAGEIRDLLAARPEVSP